MYLYNSATHKKEEFKTHTPGHVEMYTCGPTVYHFAHIGNLRSYIMEDVLEKYLRYAGYDVNRVMNITDVGHLTSDADEGEDKMLKGAKREHKSVMEIAKFYTDAFFSDCAKLNNVGGLDVELCFHSISDLLTEVLKAVGAGVLKSNSALFFKNSVCRGLDLVYREKLRCGHAACEREDLGFISQCEELTDCRTLEKIHSA